MCQYYSIISLPFSSVISFYSFSSLSSSYSLFSRDNKVEGNDISRRSMIMTSSSSATSRVDDISERSMTSELVGASDQ